jgi:hypothetical protein
MELLLNRFLVVGGFWDGFIVVIDIESGEEIIE